jgi:tetratricopeptide (TPR) repeat protein
MADNPRIEELRRRVQADPASIAFAALAEEFRRVGRHEEAIEACRTGLQRHPSYLSARVTLGRALLETGQFAAAREELDYVLRAAPENLAAIRALAEIHARQRHAPEGIEHYDHVLQNAALEEPSPAAAPVAVAAQPAAGPSTPLPLSPVVAAASAVEKAPNRAMLASLERFLSSIQAARQTFATSRPISGR